MCLNLLPRKNPALITDSRDKYRIYFNYNLFKNNLTHPSYDIPAVHHHPHLVNLKFSA